MIYYLTTLEGLKIIGFDSLTVAKYRVIEHFIQLGEKLNISFTSYDYGKNGIKATALNFISFDSILIWYNSNNKGHGNYYNPA